MAANVQALAAQFKADLMNGYHAIGVPPVRSTAAADSFKAALFLANNNLSDLTGLYAPSASVTANVSSGSTSMDVTAVGSGQLTVGQTVANADLPSGTYITAGPALGGTGTYTLSAAATAAISSGTITASQGEASGSGYTAGGVAVPNATAPATSGSTAYWTPSGSFSWTGLTLSSFDSVMIYNSSQGNRAVGVFTFGSQSVTSGNFTLSMPANGPTTALIQLN